MIFLEDNWQILAGFITSIFAFFSGKKMKIADEKKATSEALETMQRTYDTFVNDFRERYNEIKEELKTYREEQLTTRNEIVQLRQENTELRKELKDWEGKYTKLKKEFDSNKK